MTSVPPGPGELPENAIAIRSLSHEALTKLAAEGAPFLVFPAWARTDREASYNTEYARSRSSTPAPGAIAFQLTKSPGRPFPDQIGVGRARNSDICLPFSDISKYHGCFFRSDDSWELMDASSANGTQVNGDPLTPKTRVAVPAGSQINFAKHRCIFVEADDFVEAVASFSFR